MPAVIQPPSEKLTKLKLFLEKTKTDFYSENSELADWMNDRKLVVEQLGVSKKDQELQQIEIDSVEKELVEKLAQSKTTDKPLASKITKEEFDSIMEKIVELLKLPAGKLEEESELYLEQQLSDILGFDVNANLDGHTLLFSTGVMKATSHLKRSPTDTLENHTNYHEAGLSLNRSAFGWFSGSTEIDQTAIDQEKYYVAVPLYYHEDWNTKFTELKQWYKFRKVVVINPAERIAVVGVIGDIGPSTYTRRQFGGSPELIHAGKIWSPKSAGKVLLLFVDDPKNTVQLGPILL
ncbi:MAG: hypothetical protein BroJett025_05390 [Patescibacteria group bacterium]|nr:MAG: hypothetical protein BroJett025_05390 [Patescibacteria group bacterium]